VTVAGGRFAPGHLGKLTQQVPFEMVDAVPDEACRVQWRVRDLPARVVVYLLLAGRLFAELGYAQVWRRPMPAIIASIATHPVVHLIHRSARPLTAGSRAQTRQSAQACT
jgi:membrane-associated phospholipid phosphatase